MLAGLFRPQLVISRGVVDSLPPEQLAAALEHERGHMIGRDNLKRLALLLVPGLLPGIHGFGGLESAWARSPNGLPTILRWRVTPAYRCPWRRLWSASPAWVSYGP